MGRDATGVMFVPSGRVGLCFESTQHSSFSVFSSLTSMLLSLSDIPVVSVIFYVQLGYFQPLSFITSALI